VHAASGDKASVSVAECATRAHAVQRIVRDELHGMPHPASTTPLRPVGRDDHAARIFKRLDHGAAAMPSILFRMLALLAALVVFASAAPARADTPALILDVAAVEAAIARGALVWDVRGEEDFRKGHIPGALNLDDAQLVLRDSKTEDWLPVDTLAKLLGDAGIDASREIVVYGAKAGTHPYFAQQTLRWLGVERASVFHGGFDDWKAAGKLVSTEPARAAAVTFVPKLSAARVVDTRDVVARLGRADVQLVDARTRKEFDGDDIRALRGGHIPGAVNIPYETNWLDPDTPRKLQRRQVANKDGMTLKAEADLRALYAGLDPAKETIVYCQSGVRASQTATVLESLGFTNVKLYDGSWLGYGNTMDAPAESVAYFNVGRVNNLLNLLQSRIDDLEAQVNELRGQKKAQ
jgi:thiosulfate/3-mercaptopyruvate sulfurtransferase